MFGTSMEKQSVATSSSASSSNTTRKKKSDFFNIIKTGKFLRSSSSSADTGKGRSKSSSGKVAHGFHLVEGKAGHDMEDYLVAEYKTRKNRELGLFAIFDGHLGDRVPSYLKENLFRNILDEPNFWDDPEAAIKNAYSSTDKLILENASRLGPGGSTAVTAIVIDGKDLWVANIGDSRAVLCERGCANQLSVDHEPHTERKRIEKQGGFVITLPVKSVKDPQVAAKRLTTEALERKSKDDISCIVIRFGG
ncbi:hypothetical protein MKW94_025926 [Papaver nudicaule]|uniref:PPM-type phosphatase domain-containing protein n=1 Tax=Papaver nudicaule TaxID=74823 RepID=A0AA41RZK5_PAPNU|nr:hypothetical protein [Papaver nudicaule]